MNKNQLLELQKNYERANKMYEEYQEKSKDPKYVKAEKLSESAWDLVRTKKKFNPEKAIELAMEAAKLHDEFLPNIDFLKQEIKRQMKIGPVKIKETINKKFLKCFFEMGFKIYSSYTLCEQLTNWNYNTYLIKIEKETKLSALIDRDKFGHDLGILIWRERRGKEPELLNLGLDKTDTNYLNQEEFENVMKRIIKVINDNLEIWLSN